MKEDWVKIQDGMIPKDLEENELVWAYNSITGFIYLACLVYIENEGWFWAVNDGNVYNSGNRITGECELDDEYEFTHYHHLPKLPKEEK